MKGLFIPGITAKMFKDASLESVAELMSDGKIYDIDYQEPSEDCIRRAKALEVERKSSMNESITKILEEVKKSMCDDYCKYPNMKTDNENWLFEKGSPCETCPLNRL